MKNLNLHVFRPLTLPSTKSLFLSTVKKQGPLNLRTISGFLTPLHHCGNSADMKLKICHCVEAPSCWPVGFFPTYWGGLTYFGICTVWFCFMQKSFIAFVASMWNSQWYFTSWVPMLPVKKTNILLCFFGGRGREGFHQYNFFFKYFFPKP